MLDLIDITIENARGDIRFMRWFHVNGMLTFVTLAMVFIYRLIVERSLVNTIIIILPMGQVACCMKLIVMRRE